MKTNSFALLVILMAAHACTASPLDVPAEWQQGGYCLGRIAINQLVRSDNSIAPLNVTVPFRDARLSGDASTLAGDTADGMVVIDRESGRVARFHEVKATEGIAISSKGEWLAWRGRDDEANTSGLHVLKVSTRQKKRVSATGVNPGWSVGGWQLLYSDRDEIILYDAEAQVTRPIGQGSEPTWKSINQVSYRTSTNQIVVVNTIDGSTQTIMSGESVSSPLQWSSDGRYAFYVSTDFRLSCLRGLGDASAVVAFRVSDGGRNVVASNCSRLDYEYQWINDNGLCGIAR